MLGTGLTETTIIGLFKLFLETGNFELLPATLEGFVLRSPVVTAGTISPQ